MNNNTKLDSLNIFFISYGIYEHDGRLRELMNVAKHLGNAQYIIRSMSNATNRNGHIYIVNGSGIFGYLKFIISCLVKWLKNNNIDILFVDNRKASLVALLMMLMRKPKYIVVDLRELYIINEVKSIIGKLGCISEYIIVKHANVIICANKYRAEIMKNYYELKTYPLIFDNVRSLKYSGKYTKKQLDEKFGHYFSNNTIKVISTSGCNISRTNERLVRAMVDLGVKYELFLVGGGDKRDIHLIKKIIKEYKLNNVHLLGKLDQDELKYFIRKCHIGIVNYSKDDMNNKYCASGKIYEFLFEGKPVVTTENIPLVELCKNYQIGVSNDNYAEGIMEVTQNYDFYVKNVNKYIAAINVDRNNMQLVENIKKALRIC